MRTMQDKINDLKTLEIEIRDRRINLEAQELVKKHYREKSQLIIKDQNSNTTGHIVAIIDNISDLTADELALIIDFQHSLGREIEFSTINY